MVFLAVLKSGSIFVSVFHGIRFKVNEDWESGKIPFFCARCVRSCHKTSRSLYQKFILCRSLYKLLWKFIYSVPKFL